MLTIDKNIELPPRKGRANSNGMSETFRQMAVGDSFECDYTPGRRAGIYSVASRQGIKIAVRVTDDKMRVWRLV